jgi:hypothetical protein
MWRVQVWKENKIIEAFLQDTQEECETMKQELEMRYPSAEYEVRADEYQLKNFNLFDPKNAPLLELLAQLVNPLNYIR